MTSLLASQRRATILADIDTAGAVKVSDLVNRLGVSDMTVRRDIERLARDGLLERVHGGAMALNTRSSDEPGFTAKSSLMTREKQAIGEAAAALVTPGSAIGISAGTTTFELARALRGVPHLTVVTNSVPVAQLLHESGTSGQTVVLTGGIRTPSDALVGPVAVSALRTLHVDLLFLGVHGMDPRAGLTTPNIVEAETNRALIESARRVCVTADHSKWGVVGLSTIIDLGEMDLLITDDHLSSDARAHLADCGADVLAVGPEGSRVSAPGPRRRGSTTGRGTGSA